MLKQLFARWFAAYMKVITDHYGIETPNAIAMVLLAFILRVNLTE